MDQEVLNLDNINEIDMECNIDLDDDDTFVIKSSPSDKIAAHDGYDDVDGRNLRSVTGVIVNLSDDDNVVATPKKHIANIEDDSQLAHQPQTNNLDDIDNVNSIDLETDYFDEDDEDLVAAYKYLNKNKSDLLDFSDEDGDIDDFASKTLIDESDISEKKAKRKTSIKNATGNVEADYWKDITKKHRESNKKGAYSTHFRFTGDPEKEAAIFNHMMGSDSSDTDISDFYANSDLSSVSNFSSEGSGDFSGGEAGGCCESLNENYSKQLIDLFDLIGFEVIKNSDNTLSVIDNCQDNNDFSCANLDELLLTLTPYIHDFIIIPLQVNTGKDFTDYKDWCNWYSDKNNQEQYPKCKSDIAYCDLLANHLSECTL